MTGQKTPAASLFSQNYRIVKGDIVNELQKSINPATKRPFTGLELLSRANAEFKRTVDKDKRDLRPVDAPEAVALFDTYYDKKKSKNADYRRQLDFQRRRAMILRPKEARSYLYRPTRGTKSGPEMFDFEGVDDGSRWVPGSGMVFAQGNDKSLRQSKIAKKRVKTRRARSNRTQ